MRQRTPSLNDDHDYATSSSSASPTTRQRAFDQRRAPHTRTRTRTSSSHHEPTLTGSIGKLVRLALFAVVLALVVPYLRAWLFGGSTGVTPKNTTVDVKVAETPFSQQVDVFGSGDDDKVDVFNFKHEDYLAPSARAAKSKHGGRVVAAKTSPPVVVSKNSKAKAKKQQSKGTTTESASKSRSRPKAHDDDSDDQDDDQDHQGRSPTASILSTLSYLSLTLYHLSRATLYILVVPFSHLFRLSARVFSGAYHYFRLSLSHTLLPVSHILAPLSYLVSGIFFVFIQTPFNLISAIVTELYPVYIFLGAATVVGLGMGIMAAGVLYLSAFLFVDRVQSVDGGSRLQRIKAPGGHGKGKQKMVLEDQDGFDRSRITPASSYPSKAPSQNPSASYDQYSYQKPPQQLRNEYFNQPLSGLAPQGPYVSPLLSPSSPYRSSNVRQHATRNSHPAYSAASPAASTF